MLGPGRSITGAVAVVALLAGPAASPGSGAEPPTGAATHARQVPPAAEWEVGIQSLLDRRAAAVRDRDRAAFMATVDPDAGEEFRADQERLFSGLASVDFSTYELELRTDDLRDVSAGVQRGRGADETRLPAVEERLRIRDIDGVDLVSNFWYTFVRRGGRWFVNADDDVADLGLITQMHLWDFGPVAFTPGSSTVVMSQPADAERARALLEISEDAFARLGETLDWSAPPKLLVVLPGSTDQLESILQANFDLSNFVAFATADVDRDDDVGGWAWTAPRVYAQEDNLARHGTDFQIETMHHEFVHAVGFDLAGPHVPNWLHEGHADYLALGRPAPQPVAGSDGRLPFDFQFLTGDRSSILEAYRESTSAVAFLAAQRAPEAPSALFEALGRVRVEPGTWRYHLDRALAQIYGAGFDEFEADWAGR